MSDERATAAEVNDWVQECLSNPDVLLRTTDAMVSADPDALKGYMVHASRFLAYGRQALTQSESALAQGNDPFDLCEKSLEEYSLARRAEDATSEHEEVHEQEVVVKPAGLFRKAQTEVRKTIHKITRNDMDSPLFEEHLDAVASILEVARPTRVQQLLGRTKLRYILAAHRVSVANAVQERMDGDDSVKRDVRSVFEAFVDAPFAVGSAMLVSYMDSVIACSLYEELEPFGAHDKQNPFSIVMFRKGAGQTSWTQLGPVKPIGS